MTPPDLGVLVDQAALVITAVALIVAALTWVATRRWNPTIPILLELLTAAGLVRLSVTDSWQAIAAAAAIVAVRTLVKLGAAASHTGAGDDRATTSA